jgi:hypothetical protein
VLKSDSVVFHTTFTHAKNTTTWQWLMDNEEGGKLQPGPKYDAEPII